METSVQVRVVVGGVVCGYFFPRNCTVRDVVNRIYNEYVFDAVQQIKLLRFVGPNTFVQMRLNDGITVHSPEAGPWILSFAPKKATKDSDMEDTISDEDLSPCAEDSEDSEADLEVFQEGLAEEAAALMGSSDSESEEEANPSTIPAP
jgi:hypothetical protein